MIMGTIRFTERCLVIKSDDGNGHRRYSAIYEAGECITLPEPSCQRWIRRGKAVRVEAPKPKIEEPIHGVQTETQTEAPLNPVEEPGDASESTTEEPASEPETAVVGSGGIGIAGAAEFTAESAPLADPEPVDGSDRRPRGRRPKSYP